MPSACALDAAAEAYSAEVPRVDAALGGMSRQLVGAVRLGLGDTS